MIAQTPMEAANELAQDRGYAGYFHAPAYVQGDVEAALCLRGIYVSEFA